MSVSASSQSSHKNRVQVALLMLVAGLLGIVWVPGWYILVFIATYLIVKEVATHTVYSNRPVSGAAYAVSGLVLLVAGVGAWEAVRLRSVEHGVALICILVGSTAINDVAAYFGGKSFGTAGTFYPKISPKKSLHGAVFGGIGGAASFMAFWAIAEAVSGTGIDVWPALGLAVLLQVVAMHGDLLSSWAKRLIGIKDWDDTFGDHGGANDRLDSHLAVLAVFSVYHSLFL